MFTILTRRAALAALLAVSAGAARAASVDMQSAPAYWGQTGNTAILAVMYDSDAKQKLIINTVYIGDVYNDPLNQTLDNCGTPIKQGDNVVGYSLAPGQHCFLQSTRQYNVSLYGEVVMSDTAKNTTNIATHVRAMLEVRDANNNVLTHAEMH